MTALTPVRAELVLRFETAFHLGTGRGDGAAQRAIRRRADGTPYVPGSALKGALRHAAERVAARVDAELVAMGAEATERIGRRHRAGTVLDAPCLGPSPSSLCIGETACVVCRIFGNPSTGTRLLVSDGGPAAPSLLERAREATGAPLRVGTERIARVQIDRRSRGARAQALFTSETARPDAEYRFTLLGQVPLSPRGASQDPEAAPAELVLLAAAIRATRQLGADRSIGRGSCRLTAAPGSADALLAGGVPYPLDALVEGLPDLVWANL